MSSQFQAPRFSGRIAQVLIGSVLTIVLLLVCSGPARTDDPVVVAVDPPICKDENHSANVPDTAITAVYCAYSKGAPFGPSLSGEESWGDPGDVRRRFLFGTIYFVKQSNAAFALFNHVRDYYESHPLLGKPITSEIGSQDKGFCKAFFTGTQMIECKGVNNPVAVPWTSVTVHLPELEMPFPTGTTGVFSGGPHNWYDGYQTLDDDDSSPGSGLDIAMTGQVLAVAGGTVIEVENGNNNPDTCRGRNTGLGCWVAVRNDFSGTVVVYGHILPGAEVKVGHWIEPRMEIGKVEPCDGADCVGGSPAAHLHLELWDGRSTGSTETQLWGTQPLSWHGVILGDYLFSGGFVSVDSSGNTGNVYDYDGTAIKIDGADLDVHRLYTQPELQNLLDSDEYVFEKFRFNDAEDTGYPKDMYAWMTKAAWDSCKSGHERNGNYWCEELVKQDGTVFSKGSLVGGANPRRVDEVEPVLDSSSVAKPYDPLFSPPDDPSAPPTCTPTADQVAIYDDPNYGIGKPCRLLNIGTYDSLGSLDNVTSSVKVGANVKVTLYSEPSRGGQSETLTSDDPDLADNESIQRNEASSALVQSRGGGGGSCQPNDYQVALFDDVYFNPNKPCRVLGMGDYSSLSDLDNIVSSVKVGSKVKLVLFENPGYGGDNETFYEDDYNLDDNDHIQKNEASSAKVLSRETGGFSYCSYRQSPGDTEVILFDEPDYLAGPCAILKVGGYPDLSTISFENLASSIRVGREVKVRVCTKKNYDESAGECTTFKGDISDLNVQGDVPRNEASSARVEMKLHCNPLPDGIVLYENSDYRDGCATLTAGTWNLSDFHFDDIASSLRFVGTYATGGWMARLCQGANLTGTCSTFTGSDNRLSDDAVGGDKASSISIGPLPPASAPSLTEIDNPEGLGTYQVTWTTVAWATRYELEQQLNGFAWSIAYTGEAASAVMAGRDEGSWCYRVRGVNSAGAGPWSNTAVCTTVAPPVANPDLIVSAITPSNTSPTVGQGVSVDVMIQNIGQGTAGASTCTLYRGDPAAGGSQIDSKDCPTLSAGTSGVVTFGWTPAQAGQVTLFVVADNGNILPEVDESNNRGSANVTVQPPAVTCYMLSRTHTGDGGDPVAAPANSPGCAAGSYSAATTIALTASPNSDWQVKNWSGTSDNTSTSTTNSTVMPAGNHTVSVVYESIPVGWTAATVGANATGSATAAGTQVFVKATGGDLWSTADGFQFAYRSGSGDREFVARLDNWSSGGVTTAKSGLSIRSSLDPSSPHFTVHVTGPNAALKLKWRTAAGATTSFFNGPTGSALPVWLKLVKNSSTITAFYSTNGTNWTQMGTPQTIAGLDGSYTYGIVAASTSPSVEASATFEVPGPDAPTITGFTPASGGAGTAVTINGTNLTGATSVKFGTTAATTFNVLSTDQLTAAVPAGAASGKISVTTAGGTAVSQTDFVVEAIGCTPGENGIVLYEHANYGGRCLTLLAGDSDLADNIFDNVASSVKFVGSYAGKGYQISLFDSAGFAGPFINTRINDPDLSNNQPLGTDKATSIRIWQDTDDDRTLTLGQWLNGTMNVPSDADGHLFYATAGQYVTVTMERRGGGLDPYLTAFGPNWGSLGSDNDGAGNGNARIYEMKIWTTGTQRVFAQSYLGGTQGTYRLKVELATCAPGVNGIVLYEGPDFTGRCRTLTADDASLVDNRFDDVVSSVAFVGSYAGGTYQITLFDGANFTGTRTNFRFNDRNLSDNAIGQDRTTSIRIWQDGDDDRTLVLEQAVAGTIHAASDTDVYLFNGVAGQAVTITMDKQSAALDPYLVLYGPNWAQVGLDNDGGGNGNARLYRVTMPATGVYRISAQSFAGSAGTYQVKVTAGQ